MSLSVARHNTVTHVSSGISNMKWVNLTVIMPDLLIILRNLIIFNIQFILLLRIELRSVEHVHV